ncbi:NAD(P)/FAD-dependent oxidoreductase [cf. Phormidesmis sp. LEGE 11477]|uniref:FAD-dependent oxidoreductase n=1 Tax=cf. Phormidesmis sp. LEGE 11477 TaxID=1828680 RepID=UPI00187EDDEC|nr:FAD-dependent monooxygenase [cf. Phormidesmis sp. LEGE 11477]MBE9062625.1 monooxygenase [cf. Phormidesmis sp. LEGE 11477]
MQSPLLKRAIVIGGSIAGLLSAKVLSDYFEEVVIVERDVVARHPTERTGVPQSPQPHILLTHGYRLLKGFVPSLKDDLLAAGAVPIDWGQDFQSFVFGDWSAVSNEPTGLESFSCTRPLLEAVIRQHVEQLSNVRRLSPYRVEALVGSGSKVTGIRCKRSKGETDEQTVEADLVVDASGRSSNALTWLEAIGASVPACELVNAQLGYATQRYRIPDRWDEDWKVLLVTHRPPKLTKLGYLARVENNELIATLGGYCQQYPPLEQSEFLAFAQQLPSARFHEVISHLSPISEIKAYRATANRLYRYERLVTMPNGFIAIGDSVCALCPAYGQGLTTSAMSALTLRDWLLANAKKSQVGDSLTFQKQLAKQIKPAWSAATNNDAGFLRAEAIAKKSPIARLLGLYRRRLVAKIHTDSELALALTKVAHMVDSPLTLLHPKLLSKAFM